MAVPHSTAYDAQKYGTDWAAYDAPRRLWPFTPETIQKLANQHGFELSNSYPMPFDAFYISMMSEKYRKSTMPSIRGAITGAMAWCSAQKNKEKSSSMIYIFRKKNR